jgi:hypothetical protein
MQHLEGSGTPVLYIGRTVLTGWERCASTFFSELKVEYHQYTGLIPEK